MSRTKHSRPSRESIREREERYLRRIADLEAQVAHLTSANKLLEDSLARLRFAIETSGLMASESDERDEDLSFGDRSR